MVALLCEGRSNRDIAEELGISEETVSNQMVDIFNRTGMGSRLEVVVRLLPTLLGLEVAPLEAERDRLRRKCAELREELERERKITARLLAAPGAGSPRLRRSAG